MAVKAKKKAMDIMPIIATAGGGVVGSVLASMIKSQNIAGLGKFSGAVVGAAGVTMAFFFGKNEMIKNIGVGMAASGAADFAGSMIGKPTNGLDNEASYIGAIPRISDSYMSVEDNVAQI